VSFSLRHGQAADAEMNGVTRTIFSSHPLACTLSRHLVSSLGGGGFSGDRCGCFFSKQALVIKVAFLWHNFFRRNDSQPALGATTPDKAADADRSIDQNRKSDSETLGSELGQLARYCGDK